MITNPNYRVRSLIGGETIVIADSTNGGRVILMVSTARTLEASTGGVFVSVAGHEQDSGLPRILMADPSDPIILLCPDCGERPESPACEDAH